MVFAVSRSFSAAAWRASSQSACTASISGLTAPVARSARMPPLTPAELAAYFAESRTLAGLFGLPAAELPADWPVAVAVAFHPSPSPPTFENRYTAQGRQQILHAASEAITLADIPLEWRAAPVVHLGPVMIPKMMDAVTKKTEQGAE